MIANVMPFHGTHVGGLGGLSIPEIDSDSKALMDLAEGDSDDKTSKKVATILAEIGQTSFKAKQFERAFAYYSAAASLGDFPDAEYNAARSLQEASKVAKAKDDLATAKEAATDALAWFHACVTTSNLTKSLDTKADAEKQIGLLTAYISDLGKKDVNGKNGDDDKKKDGMSPMLGLGLGLGLIWLISRGK